MCTVRNQLLIFQRSKETIINKENRLIRVLGFTGKTYLPQILNSTAYVNMVLVLITVASRYLPIRAKNDISLLPSIYESTVPVFRSIQ